MVHRCRSTRYNNAGVRHTEEGVPGRLKSGRENRRTPIPTATLAVFSSLFSSPYCNAYTKHRRVSTRIYPSNHASERYFARESPRAVVAVEEFWARTFSGVSIG